VGRRITLALEKLEPRPRRRNRLRGEPERLFTVRLGDVRAVYGLDTKKSAVAVLAVGSRREVYNK
jgi:mRNA-degrading endonuclease RelE of RelBE toxin-antitoxin system